MNNGSSTICSSTESPPQAVPVASITNDTTLYHTNNTVKISKLHVNSKKASKLGSALATWNKIKSAADNNNDSDSEIFKKQSSYNTMIENGPQGEICLLFGQTLEIWKYSSISDSLDLHLQFKLPGDIKINAFKVKYTKGYLLFIIGSDMKEHNYLQVIDTSSSPVKVQSSIKLCPSTNYTMKVTKCYVTVGCSNGIILIYNCTKDGKLFNANDSSKLSTIQKQTNFGVSDINLSEDEFCLRTCVDEDDQPIYDIVDDWLIYSPTKAEINQLKHSKDDRPRNRDQDLDPIITNFNSTMNAQHSSLYTPIKVGSKTPMFNKLLSSFSKSALDGLFKISKSTSIRFKQYMDNKLELQEFSKSIGKSLYSNLQKSSHILQSNDEQLLILIDIKNDSILAVFKPPEGVSYVSLSPFDLQLLSSNSKGDSIYLWDLSRLPLEISLVEKYTRGKTSAIIKDLIWKDKFAFGCITKSTGSIHWHNSGTTNTNDWILSRFKAKKFLNLSDSLATLDSKNRLKVFNPKDGQQQYEFNLPDTAVTGFKNKLELDSSPETINKEVVPLSQAEIETCSPFLNMINHKRIQFATYDPEINTFEDFGNDIKDVTTFKFITSKRKSSKSDDADCNKSNDSHNCDDDGEVSINDLFIYQDSE